MFYNFPFRYTEIGRNVWAKLGIRQRTPSYGAYFIRRMTARTLRRILLNPFSQLANERSRSYRLIYI